MSIQIVRDNNREQEELIKSTNKSWTKVVDVFSFSLSNTPRGVKKSTRKKKERKTKRREKMKR